MSFNALFEFEEALAKYTGALYAVVTDGGTHAIELCLRYKKVTTCEFTAHTYLSIPMLMHHLNIKYRLINEDWLGEYCFYNTNIWDSARRLQPNMYMKKQMQCLSFGYSKPLELGKGGAILLDDPVAYKQLSQMRSDGRDLHITPWEKQTRFTTGYHYCPTLELCREGIKKLPGTNCVQDYPYPDLREINIDHSA
jgi:dTDP-4-amino-4,6-dideoxygalactose transaminase